MTCNPLKKQIMFFICAAILAASASSCALGSFVSYKTSPDYPRNKKETLKLNGLQNKVAPPFRTAEFDLLYGEGISKVGEIVDLGVDLNIVKKSGSWFSYGDTKLAQGRDAAKTVIKDNPELAAELEAKIVEAIKEK